SVVIGRVELIPDGVLSDLDLDRIREQPEQELARIDLPDEVVQVVQADRTEQTGIERAVLQRGDAEVRAHGGRIGEVVRVSESNVAAGRARNREAGRYGNAPGIGPDQERRQSERRLVLHAGIDLRNGRKAHRPVMAGAGDSEEDGSVARLGQAAIDGIVTRVDGIDDRARPHRAGKQYAGDHAATPHDATPAHADFYYACFYYCEYLCTAARGRQAFAAI